MSSEVRDIVRFADSQDAERLMMDVLEHELPPVLEGLVAEYTTYEGARDHFMWKWVHELAPQNTLPCVDPEYRDRVPTDKTITILYVTLLDDVLEKRRDRATFEEVSKLPFEHREADPDREDADADYVEFTRRVWETLLDRLREAPRYEEYAELFRYDVKQAINAIEYTNLAIERPDLTTLPDLERYESHNMVMFAYADIDLMYTGADVGEELDTLRRGIWHAQQMARIGNWLSTWERELREGDYSSGVIVYALQDGIVDESDLDAVEEGDLPHEELVERIEAEDVESVFLDRWDDHYDDLGAIDEELSRVDLTPFMEGLKEVLRYHLASRGLK